MWDVSCLCLPLLPGLGAVGTLESGREPVRTGNFSGPPLLKSYTPRQGGLESQDLPPLRISDTGSRG